MKNQYRYRAAALLTTLVLSAGVAVADEGARNADTTVNTDAFKPIADQSHFSQAVKAGGLLFCSGSVGVNPDGTLPDDLETEFRNAFQNAGAVLAEAGLTFADVVDITTYHVDDEKITDEEHNKLFMKVHGEFMSAPWSSWTGVGITKTAVPGAHVEIRVIAKLK